MCGLARTQIFIPSPFHCGSRASPAAGAVDAGHQLDLPCSAAEAVVTHRLGSVHEIAGARAGAHTPLLPPVELAQRQQIDQ